MGFSPCGVSFSLCSPGINHSFAKHNLSRELNESSFISAIIVTRESAMLETLIGRLKWERTGDEIRVAIPARLSWGAIRKLLDDLGVVVVGYLGLFVITGCVAYLRGLSFHAFVNSEGIHTLFTLNLGYCAGLIIARMVPRLFGKTVVTLNPVKTTIGWNARLGSSKDVFPTATLHSFRFVERSGDVPVQNKIGQNEVQFCDSHWTRFFGVGITREEAQALIAKITEVYPFPMVLPVESSVDMRARQSAALS